MSSLPLTDDELAMIRGVFQSHPEVATVMLFGSRAKGNHTARSDIDLALTGNVTPLRAQAIASELDELPLPYQFDVQSLDHIRHGPLRDHIQRVGIPIYPR